jgi:hypothetical protein
LYYDTPAAGTRNKHMSKIKLDIYGMNIDDEIAYLGPIVTKMTGNSAFTTLASKTTALVTAVTAYSAANADYLAAQLTLDQKRTAAGTAARDLATGAESLTRDAATFQSGGWEIAAATHTPVGQLPRPANLVATGGDLDGTVDLSWDPSSAASKPTSPSKPPPPADPGRNATSAKPPVAPSPA